MKKELTMTYYEKEVNRIKSICYSNQGQIDTIIGTRNYIDNNFESNLNLNILSKVRFISKFHLLRLFKRYYGITPAQYLIERRIQKSKEYLGKGTSVTETCFLVGFESPGSFSTLFRNKIGLTPTEFQKKQLSRSRLSFGFGTCHY
jgi:AraC-like DNA-binding protein